MTANPPAGVSVHHRGESSLPGRRVGHSSPGSSGRAVDPGGLRKGATLADLLTPAQVATMFGVTPVTVTRWAKAGKLTSIRTPGGHRRYRRAEVLALLRRAS